MKVSEEEVNEKLISSNHEDEITEITAELTTDTEVKKKKPKKKTA